MNVLALKLLAAAVLIAGVASAGYLASERVWRARWNERETEIAAERLAWNARVARAEEAHAAQITKEREKFNANIKAVNDRLGAALGRLRDAEQRAAEQAAVADGASRGDGPGTAEQPVLSGEVALRLASGADETAERLALCQASLRSALRAVGDVP